MFSEQFNLTRDTGRKHNGALHDFRSFDANSGGMSRLMHTFAEASGVARGARGAMPPPNLW